MAIINVKVTELRPNGKSFVNEQIEKAVLLSNKHTEALAKETVNVIREHIKEGTKRANSTGKLATSFYMLQIPGGHGVGDIAYLNKHAPYWRHINYGSFAIGANWKHQVTSGIFSPGIAAPASQYAGEGNQGPDRWMSNMGVGGKMFSFIPTKEIKAHNYIEQTVTEMLRRLPHIIGGIKIQ